MSNYTTVFTGTDGDKVGSDVVVTQNSILSDLTFSCYYEDDTEYTFSAGDVVTGVFLDKATLTDVYAITGTLTPAEGANTFTWERASADTGQPGDYSLTFKVVGGSDPDYSILVSYKITATPDGVLVPAVPLVGIPASNAAWLTQAIATVPDATDLVSAADIADKANKITGGTEDNFTSITAGGDIQDSGSAAADFDTAGSAAAAETAAGVTALTSDLEKTNMIAGVGEMLNDIDPITDKSIRQTSLEYVDANTRYIWEPLNGIHWLRMQLDFSADGIWDTGEGRVYQLLDSVNDTDTGITYGGTGAWGVQASPTGTGAVGESRHYAYNDDHYLEFDVTGTDSLWIVYQGNPLGGYVKPTIDGSQAITRKHMPTLVGSDYVWSVYTVGGAPALNQKIADGLNPQKTYTVRLAVLPVATIPPGASDNRFYFEAYAVSATRYDSAGIQDLANTSKRLQTPYEPDNGWTIDYQPPGAASAELFGGPHGNEVANGAATWADSLGNDLDVSATITITTAQSIQLLQSSYGRHSETSTTNHADITRSLTFSQLGIRYGLRVTWITAPVVNYGYFGMMPVDTNRIKFAGFAEFYTMTNNDGVRYGQVKSNAAIMWDTTLHNFAMVYHMDNPGTFDNLESSGFIEYLDAVVDGGKLYPKFINDTFTATPGNIIDTSWTWRVVDAVNIGVYL